MDEKQKKLIAENPYNISNIDNPSEELQLLALEECVYVFDFIENPCSAAWERYFEAVKFFTEGVDEGAQIEFVKENYNTISIILNPSEKVQMESVKADAFSVMNIGFPTELVLETALKFCKNHPQREMIEEYVLGYLNSNVLDS